MKTRNCDECAHFSFGSLPDAHITGNEVCKAGHRPRYYSMRSVVDFSYGWKRRCADFVALPANGERK